MQNPPVVYNTKSNQQPFFCYIYANLYNINHLYAIKCQRMEKGGGDKINI